MAPAVPKNLESHEIEQQEENLFDQLQPNEFGFRFLRLLYEAITVVVMKLLLVFNPERREWIRKVFHIEGVKKGSTRLQGVY